MQALKKTQKNPIGHDRSMIPWEINSTQPNLQNNLKLKFWNIFVYPTSKKVMFIDFQGLLF